ncbi:hypothetical protein CRM22_005943 [Opisthorchis felineus]|uniref:Uncharacterized protein n=1 Tax=Opisthorchis felineus TaxID=147828 RepID=A0A4S2LNN6_OPIFE|nr:hypothetical protein CRM22_005943 [Opisthorchis felineus]
MQTELRDDSFEDNLLYQLVGPVHVSCWALLGKVTVLHPFIDGMTDRLFSVRHQNVKTEECNKKDSAIMGKQNRSLNIPECTPPRHGIHLDGEGREAGGVQQTRTSMFNWNFDHRLYWVAINFCLLRLVFDLHPSDESTNMLHREKRRRSFGIQLDQSPALPPMEFWCHTQYQGSSQSNWPWGILSGL